jgi:hypothetical protein
LSRQRGSTATPSPAAPWPPEHPKRFQRKERP